MNAGGMGGFQTVESLSRSSLLCLYKVVNDAVFSPDGQKAGGQFGSFRSFTSRELGRTGISHPLPSSSTPNMQVLLASASESLRIYDVKLLVFQQMALVEA